MLTSLNRTNSLATVDDDVFRLDSFLQHSLFGMLSSSSEQTRRLNLEIPNPFLVVIQQAVAVFINDLLVGFFQSLQQIFVHLEPYHSVFQG